MPDDRLILNRATQPPKPAKKLSALAIACQHITVLAKQCASQLARIVALEQRAPVPGPAGPSGPAGRGIVKTIIDSEGRLILTLTDGETVELPCILGPAGPRGEKGERGEAVVGPAGPKGDPGESIVGPAGPRGEKGEPGEAVVGPAGPRGEKGERGSDGRSIVAGHVNEAGLLILSFTDGSECPAGRVVGPAGPKGEPGESVVGPAGPRGEKGKPGESVVGPAGPKGDRGPAGEAGAAAEVAAAIEIVDGGSAELRASDLQRVRVKEVTTADGVTHRILSLN